MVDTIKVRCPICKKTVEKTSDYIQKCPLCNFYFDVSSKVALEELELLEILNKKLEEIANKELEEVAIALEKRNHMINQELNKVKRIPIVFEKNKSKKLAYCFPEPKK